MHTLSPWTTSPGWPHLEKRTDNCNGKKRAHHESRGANRSRLLRHSQKDKAAHLSTITSAADSDTPAWHSSDDALDGVRSYAYSLQPCQHHVVAWWERDLRVLLGQFRGKLTMVKYQRRNQTTWSSKTFPESARQCATKGQTGPGRGGCSCRAPGQRAILQMYPNAALTFRCRLTTPLLLHGSIEHILKVSDMRSEHFIECTGTCGRFELVSSSCLIHATRSSSLRTSGPASSSRVARASIRESRFNTCEGEYVCTDDVAWATSFAVGAQT